MNLPQMSLASLDEWVTRHPSTHATRDTEWLCAFAMLAYAAVLAFPGNSFANPVFVVFHRIGFTEALCGSVLAGLGAMRLAALIVNGRSPRTPWFRVANAFAGLLVWLQLAVAILIGSEETFGIVPPVIALYAVLAGAELRSIMRASFDVRYQR